MATSEDRRAEAITWHIRLRDDPSADWAAFTMWLEGDPARSDAYDAVALADAGLGAAVATRAGPVAANDDRPRAFVRSFAWIGAVAALLLVAVLAWPLFGTARYTVVAAAGEQRSIALDGGGRIVLNGGSAVELDRKDKRYARLDRGEALFDIRHDAAAPFELAIGGSRVRDAGTRFNAVRTDAAIRIEVAEGAVLYNPDREAVRLTAGQALTDPEGTGPAVVTRKAPESIGGWRRGQLSYRQEALSTVAADLARTLGVTVTVDPAIAAQTFTGTIKVDRDQRRLFARLETVLNVEAHKEGSGWHLDAAHHPTR
jgi:transmembrane sensor